MTTATLTTSEETVAEILTRLGRRSVVFVGLMGAGKTGVRVLGMASLGRRAATIYGNVAAGFGGIGRELSSGGAVAVAASPRLTLVGEFLMRRIEEMQEIVTVAQPHPRIAGVETLRLLPSGRTQTSAYAVGGMNVEADKYAAAIQLIFMRVTDAGALDPADSYTSEWIGKPSGRQTQMLAGDGTKVIGLCGRQGLVLDAVGLVLAE